MCKYFKHAGHGDAIRIPIREIRKMGGKRKRVSRHDIPDE